MANKATLSTLNAFKGLSLYVAQMMGYNPGTFRKGIFAALAAGQTKPQPPPIRSSKQPPPIPPSSKQVQRNNVQLAHQQQSWYQQEFRQRQLTLRGILNDQQRRIDRILGLPKSWMFPKNEYEAQYNLFEIERQYAAGWISDNEYERRNALATALLDHAETKRTVARRELHKIGGQGLWHTRNHTQEEKDKVRRMGREMGAKELAKDLMFPHALTPQQREKIRKEMERKKREAEPSKTLSQQVREAREERFRLAEAASAQQRRDLGLKTKEQHDQKQREIDQRQEEIERRKMTAQDAREAISKSNATVRRLMGKGEGSFYDLQARRSCGLISHHRYKLELEKLRSEGAAAERERAISEQIMSGVGARVRSRGRVTKGAIERRLADGRSACVSGKYRQPPETLPQPVSKETLKEERSRLDDIIKRFEDKKRKERKQEDKRREALGQVPPRRRGRRFDIWGQKLPLYFNESGELYSPFSNLRSINELRYLLSKGKISRQEYTAEVRALKAKGLYPKSGETRRPGMPELSMDRQITPKDDPFREVEEKPAPKPQPKPAATPQPAQEQPQPPASGADEFQQDAEWLQQNN